MQTATANANADNNYLAAPARGGLKHGRPNGTTGPNGAPSFVPQNKHKQWYDDIVDYFMANPGASAKDCAIALGKTPVYVNMLLRSDFMRARLLEARNQRREMLNDVLVGAATSGVKKLQARIERDAGEISTGNLIEATSTLLDALGLNAKLPGGAVPNAPTIVSVQISAGVLAQARERMIEGSVAQPQVAHGRAADDPRFTELPAPQGNARGLVDAE